MIRFLRTNFSADTFRVLLVFSALMIVHPGSIAFSQERGTEETSSLTEKEVRRLRDQAEQAPGLDEEAKATILMTYDRALDQLKATADWSARAAAFDKEREEAPEQTESIENELMETSPEVELRIPPDATVAQLEQGALEARLELDAAKEEVAKLQDEVKHRLERRRKVPELLAAATSRFAESYRCDALHTSECIAHA
jgi:hypothetical protein